MLLRLQSAISLFTCSCLVCVASAPSSSIGLVMSSGEVQVDGLQVPATSAIFSGSLISSGDRSASLQFSDGTSALMKPGSTMTVYRERSVLQQGVTMQRGVDKHPVLADGLKIFGAAPNAVALVGVRDASHIEVAAQEGESDLLAPSGEIVARVEPGKTLSVAISQVDGAQGNSVKLCGLLPQNLQLTDDFTNVTYQLQGPGLGPLVGDWVQVTGTIVNGSATPQVVAISRAKNLHHPCVVPGGGGAAPAVAGSIWTGGAIALLIFVGFGGTLIGLGAAGAFGVSHPPVTPAAP